MIYNIYDIIIVKFPYSDIDKSKIRPCVIISNNCNSADIISVSVAMITSSQHNVWEYDTEIKHIFNAGLTKPSSMRMKLQTLEVNSIYKTIGKLHKNDIIQFQANLKAYLNL